MTVVKRSSIDKKTYKPIGYNDWLDYWRQKNAYYFTKIKCSAVSCSHDSTIAVPVTRIGYKVEAIYIVPFCERCAFHPYNSMIKIRPHKATLAPQNVVVHEY